MWLSACYVGEVGNQVQYTTLLHATLCTLCWWRWQSSSVHNAVSIDSVHVMLVTLLIKFSKQRCFMPICACYFGDVGNQVHYTRLLLATLCSLCWWRWQSSLVHNAASSDSVHVMLVKLIIKFSTQRCFMRIYARYVGDVGSQVQYTTLLHANLCTLCWWRW
jgi:uncharacterized membrane protein